LVFESAGAKHVDRRLHRECPSRITSIRKALQEDGLLEELYVVARSSLIVLAIKFAGALHIILDLHFLQFYLEAFYVSEYESYISAGWWWWCAGRSL
jgi:hypothetical protein